MVAYGPIDSPTRKMQNATNFDTQSIHNHLHLLIVDTDTMTCHVPRAENAKKNVKNKIGRHLNPMTSHCAVC